MNYNVSPSLLIADYGVIYTINTLRKVELTELRVHGRGGTINRRATVFDVKVNIGYPEYI